MFYPFCGSHLGPTHFTHAFLLFSSRYPLHRRREGPEQAVLHDPLVNNNGRNVQHCRNQASALSFVGVLSCSSFPKNNCSHWNLHYHRSGFWKTKVLVCAPARRREKGILSPIQWIDSCLFSDLGFASYILDHSLSTLWITLKRFLNRSDR
jgi:hypothetical protein